jgi:hypothetical protein
MKGGGNFIDMGLDVVMALGSPPPREAAGRGRGATQRLERKHDPSH